MNPDLIKSKTELRKYLVSLIVAVLLLLTNLTGWNNFFYHYLDVIFNPFLISTRLTVLNVNLFLKEFVNKSYVMAENIELKRKIVEYDEINVENEDLKKQIQRIAAQENISEFKGRKLRMVKISGVQNLYSSNPVLSVEIGENIEIKKLSPVFYSRNTLFGFVISSSGQNARVVPFYSPDLKIRIPVQSLKDVSQKGFVNKIENGNITVKNVPKSANVSIGDIWITTNDVIEIPSGVIIGKVKLVKEDINEGFKEIYLELPFNLSETNYLFIEDNE